MKLLLGLVALCLWSAPALAAATLVPGQVCGGSFANTAIAVCTFANPTTAGNAIAVAVMAPATGSLTLTGCGNTYTTADDVLSADFLSRAYTAVDLTIAGGDCTLTADVGSETFGWVFAVEVTGQDTSALDGLTDNEQTTPGVATDAVTSGPITTTVSGAFLFAATMEISLNFNGNAIASGTGWSGSWGDDAGLSVAYETRTQGAAGAISGTFTATSGADSFLTVMVAIKSGTAGPTTIPRGLLLGV